MRLTLHIGTPKAASTSIQRYLTANRGALKDHARVLYPETGLRGFAHHGYAVLLEDSSRSRAFPERPSPVDLLREATEAGVDHIIVSSEWMTFANRLERLPELFADFDVDLVVLLRRQDLYIESYYREMLKQRRMTRTITAFCDRPRVRYVVDYRALLQRWMDALELDRDAVAAIPFEPAQMTGPVEDMFLGAVGVSPDGPYRRVGRFNESLSRGSLEFLQMARRTESDIGIRHSSKLYRGLTVYTSRHPDPPEHRFFMSPGQRAEVLAGYSDSNRWVAQTFLGRDDLFHTSPVDDTTPWEPFPGLTKSDLVEIATVLADQRDAVEGLRKKLVVTRSRLDAARSTIATQQAKLDRIKRLIPGPVERLLRKLS